jgi:lipopolysaccharide transport system permease protein
MRGMTEPSAANPLAPFLQLHRHRDLFNQFARRAVELRHRASMLGLVWAVLAPLISLSIYTFVFCYVFGGSLTKSPSETRQEYALGAFLGLILFNFLTEVLSQSPHTIVTQPNFVKKVVFPLEILPAATVGAAAFHAGISLVLALVGVAVMGPGLDGHAMWLLAIAPPIAMIAFGCAWFFSALGVFVRDISNVMPFIMQILMYVSAVFYSRSLIEDKVPAWAQKLLLANPLLHAVVNARNAVVFHQNPSLKGIAYIWACGFLIYCFGYFTFRKLRPAFADVI